tara:strand:- start:2030 stop:3445 length:1416 start_codon:yes stop_codon:yes gene_type:complete
MAAKDLSGSGVLYTDRRNFYIDPQVVKELWTDVTPFTTVIANKETRTVPDPIFKMFEHRQPWVEQLFYSTDAVTTAAGALSASQGIDDGAGGISLKGLPDCGSVANLAPLKGLICEVWASADWANKTGTPKGTMLVSTVESVSGSGAEIKMYNIGNAAITGANNDVYVVTGNAHGEGGYAPEAWSDELKVVYNSCQIFKNPLEITGTLLQASLRGESSELARLRMQKSQEHKIHKERAFLFGRRNGGTGLGESAFADGLIGADVDETFADDGVAGAAYDGSHTGTAGSGAGKVRTTFGILPAILKYGASSGDNQNYFTASEASYSYGQFVDDCEKIFQYVPTSGVKKAFVGAGALGYWSKIAGNSGFAGNNGWTVNLGDMKRDALGFNYRTLETPHGMIQMIPTPALRGAWSKSMLIVDEDNLFHSQYRSPMYQTNIKTDNAFDGVKDQYMSDEGIGITNINSHSLLKITA